MKRVAVDTNVLVSFLTDRDPSQQALAAELLETAAALEAEIMLHQVVVTEMVYVLRNLYRVPKPEIRLTLEDLIATPGLKIVDHLPWSRVLGL